MWLLIGGPGRHEAERAQGRAPGAASSLRPDTGGCGCAEGLVVGLTGSIRGQRRSAPHGRAESRRSSLGVWQRCGTDRPDLCAGATLEAFERVGFAVPVEMADQLRVGVPELVGRQLV